MKQDHPNGIFIAYGSDPKEMMPRLLDRLLFINEIPKDKPVGIKPNLVVSKPSSSGATTDPRIVECIILYLQSHGIRDIVILESAWIGDNTERAFEVCGYRELAQKYGVLIVNLEHDESCAHPFRELSIRVCRQASALGYLINVPKLKAHCQTKITCALKNLKGLIPHSEKRRFHDLGLDKPIAYLNGIIRPNVTIVDGIIGDLSYEEGGTPVEMNRLIAGRDPVLIDAYASTLLGYFPSEIGHICRAADVGIGSMDLSCAVIEELNRPDVTPLPAAPNRSVDRYLSYINQDKACSACVGSIIQALKRLDGPVNLSRWSRRLHVGQGFKGRIAEGIGIGSCASGFETNLAGCPPSGLEIKRFIEKLPYFKMGPMGSLH
jgi:uncharacterized protein (DUF362 family)